MRVVRAPAGQRKSGRGVGAPHPNPTNPLPATSSPLSPLPSPPLPLPPAEQRPADDCAGARMRDGRLRALCAGPPHHALQVWGAALRCAVVGCSPDVGLCGIARRGMPGEGRMPGVASSCGPARSLPGAPASLAHPLPNPPSHPNPTPLLCPLCARSATNYCGTANNAGAILVLGRDLVMVRPRWCRCCCHRCCWCCWLCVWLLVVCLPWRLGGQQPTGVWQLGHLLPAAGCGPV